MRFVPPADNADLNAALRLASTRALVLTGGTGAALALVQKGAMICRVSVGANAPSLGCQLDITSGFSGACVRTGRALRCDDSETDPRVEVTSCRRLGIRSILAAPILVGQCVVGLLEVFSTRPFAFDDGHLAVVERLAQMALPALPACETTPPPKLLVELKPAHRVFLQNLIDVLLPPRTSPLKLTSEPARFWTDVFVPSRLPWEQFAQSMLLHVVMIVALGSFIEFWVSQRPLMPRYAFNKSDVIYYSPLEYPRAPGTERTRSGLRGRQAGLVKPPVIAVPHERDSRAQTTMTPPDLKLKPQLRLLHLVAWNSAPPAVPFSATTRMRLNTPAALVTVVAPPPEIKQASARRNSVSMSSNAVIGPPPEINQALLRRNSISMGPNTVIGPPPEISATSRPRALTTTSNGVIGPPPSMQQLSGQIGGINVGHVEVVAPAPQMSLREQGTLSTMVLASLRGMVTSVVPPPPSINGSRNSGRQRMSSLSSAPTQVAPPPVVNATRSSGKILSPAAPRPSVGQPGKWIDDSQEFTAGAKEMRVNFLGLALALPSSSYFSSHEVFIAEGQFSRYQSRLIKLVYEFLPYQHRLSDYGPNYPALDRLRVTRDPSCDEKLVQVLSSVNVPGWPRPDPLQPELRHSDQQESTLECYRTTADDYRKARDRRH